jgi:flagellar basal body-associated protein FliL
MNIFKNVRSRVANLVKRLRPAGKADDVSDDKAPSKRQEIIVTVIGCVVLAALIAGGVFWYANSRNDAGPKPEARGYTLTPPEGWTRVNPTPEGASVAFAAPTADRDATGELKAFIAVQSAPLNQQARTMAFQAIANSYVTQLAQSYQDYQFISTSDQNLGGTPAVLTTFSYSSEKAAVTSMSLFTVKDGISYAVNGETLTSAWPQHAAQIEQALLTFRP